MAVPVQVGSLAGEVCSFRGYPWWTLQDVKALVERTTGIPQTEQRLAFLAEEVDDLEQLGHLQRRSSGAAEVLQLSLFRRPPEHAAWLELIKVQGGEAFRAAPLAVRSDKELVLAALDCDSSIVDSIGAELWSDAEVVLACLRARPDREVVSRVRDELWSDRALVLAAVSELGCVLAHVGAELRGDAEVVTAAVRSDGMALQYAAPACRSDARIVLQAVQGSGAALQFASEACRADFEIVLASVQGDGAAFRFAAPELQLEPDIILAAARQCGARKVLQLAAEAVRADVEAIVDSPEASHHELRGAF